MGHLFDTKHFKSGSIEHANQQACLKADMEGDHAENTLVYAENISHNIRMISGV